MPWKDFLCCFWTRGKVQKPCFFSISLSLEPEPAANCIKGLSVVPALCVKDLGPYCVYFKDFPSKLDNSNHEYLLNLNFGAAMKDSRYEHAAEQLPIWPTCIEFSCKKKQSYVTCDDAHFKDTIQCVSLKHNKCAECMKSSAEMYPRACASSSTGLKHCSTALLALHRVPLHDHCGCTKKYL